jgi:hypothetical protein
VQAWYFGLNGPRRYRVTIDDGAVPGLITVWAMSPGEALDEAIISVDAREKINVSAAPASVETIGLEPDPDDLQATNEGWPFAPPPRLPRYDRQDVADSLIFIAILAVVGGVLGAYAYALFALLGSEWVRGVIVAAIATLPAAGLAAAWLKA